MCYGTLRSVPYLVRVRCRYVSQTPEYPVALGVHTDKCVGFHEFITNNSCTRSDTSDTQQRGRDFLCFKSLVHVWRASKDFTLVSVCLGYFYRNTTHNRRSFNFALLITRLAEMRANLSRQYNQTALRRAAFFALIILREQFDPWRLLGAPPLFLRPNTLVSENFTEVEIVPRQGRV